MERTEITSMGGYDEQKAAIRTAIACGKRVIAVLEKRGEGDKQQMLIVFYAEEMT